MIAELIVAGFAVLGFFAMLNSISAMIARRKKKIEIENNILIKKENILFLCSGCDRAISFESKTGLTLLNVIILLEEDKPFQLECPSCGTRVRFMKIKEVGIDVPEIVSK